MINAVPRRTFAWTAIATVVAMLAAACTSSPSDHSASSSSATGPQVRVNQVGYTLTSPKVAFAMLTKSEPSVHYTVAGSSGAVFNGVSTTNLGPWNAHYPAVFQLSFSGVKKPGRYHIVIHSAGASATSPGFDIASPQDLYHKLVVNAVRYFTSERDGPDVEHSVLDRQPANLTDEHAFVYATPRFSTDGNDDVLGGFKLIGGPVNVAGGWFDAGGGYEKFAYTVSYADGLMQIADRDAPPQAYPTLEPEAQFGLNWLEKLWNPSQKVMYIQVGIGNGNASNTIQGDYNFWFLPQAEDHLDVFSNAKKPYGPSVYYVEYRPVIEDAPPGQPIDPDFAGRFAADFALDAQHEAATGDTAGAAKMLALARGVYAMAKTSHIGQNLITAYPHDYYPGTQWKSDMLWGAAEMTLADEALHAPNSQIKADLKTAGKWADAYIAQGHPVGGDTLNLYDTGALAEGELLQAIKQTTVASPVSASQLLTDLAAQLKVGEDWAKTTEGEDWAKTGDPFELGTNLGPDDAAPHAFGLYTTNALYQKYGGGGQYQAFAQQQLNFALGANGWGSSFVVGAGDTFPHCMQSEIANLSGSLNGTGNIQLGAATDGPSSISNFQGLGTVAGMKKCSAGDFKPYNTKSVGYEDNVVAWPSVEPAIDYTAGPLLAFTLAGQGLG